MPKNTQTNIPSPIKDEVQPRSSSKRVIKPTRFTMEEKNDENLDYHTERSLRKRSHSTSIPPNLIEHAKKKSRPTTSKDVTDDSDYHPIYTVPTHWEDIYLKVRTTFYFAIILTSIL